jgi:hypothetical protein
MALKKLDQIAHLDLVDKDQPKTGIAYKQTKGSKRRGDQVDAINQMFAEFELAYHNQYHKAFPDIAAERLAKKYWLNCLADIPAQILLMATRELVRTQNYLPSVAKLLELCQQGAELFGLPDAHAAYLEVCRASSPKAMQAWSHPAVYVAGKQTGWFELANLPEAQIFPLFEYHYSQQVQAVIRGEELKLKTQAAIPEQSAVPLSNEDNLARLQKLRQQLSD